MSCVSSIRFLNRKAWLIGSQAKCLLRLGLKIALGLICLVKLIGKLLIFFLNYHRQLMPYAWPPDCTRTYRNILFMSIISIILSKSSLKISFYGAFGSSPSNNSSLGNTKVYLSSTPLFCSLIRTILKIWNFNPRICRDFCNDIRNRILVSDFSQNDI